MAPAKAAHRQQPAPVEQPHAVPDHAAGDKDQAPPACRRQLNSGAGALHNAIEEAPIR